MANIKLGAIITDIAGSIGGTTFRRTPNGIIVYNKQGTQIKSAFSNNAVKNKLGAILGSWGTLEPGEQNFWNDKATLFEFPDKFGNLKFLTGRQLYSKLNTQYIPTKEEISLDPFYDTIPKDIVESVTTDSSAALFEVNFVDEVFDTWVLVQVSPTTRGANPKPRKKAFCTFCEIVDSQTKANIYYNFVNQFPYVQKKSYWNVNVIFMNRTGFQSSVQSFKVQFN